MVDLARCLTFYFVISRVLYKYDIGVGDFVQQISLSMVKKTKNGMHYFWKEEILDLLVI